MSDVPDFLTAQLIEVRTTVVRLMQVLVRDGTTYEKSAGEIAGLADTTVVVMVPEGGDEVQTMKAGLMEIADIFVVNKTDRPGADMFVRNLRLMLAPAFSNHKIEVPILTTVAMKGVGLAELVGKIKEHRQAAGANDRRNWLLAERAYHLIQQYRMRDIDKGALKQALQQRNAEAINLYQFIQPYIAVV
jgi:LAO/AO transport system kinase